MATQAAVTAAVLEQLEQLRVLLQDKTNGQLTFENGWLGTAEEIGKLIRAQGFSWPLLCTGLGLVVALLYLVLRDKDQVVQYGVSTVKMPEKVEMLDPPTIKVRAPMRPRRVLSACAGEDC